MAGRDRILPAMRFQTGCVALLLAASVALAHAAEGKIIKVLPHFLDLQGRHSLSPSLFERDAYQAHLRKTPAEISSMRFDVEWSAAAKSASPRLRIELRGKKAGAKPEVVESPVKAGWFGGTWSVVKLDKEIYQQLGGIAAWRITLLDGESVLAEQKSFLW